MKFMSFVKPTVLRDPLKLVVVARVATFAVHHLPNTMISYTLVYVTLGGTGVYVHHTVYGSVRKSGVDSYKLILARVFWSLHF